MTKRTASEVAYFLVASCLMISGESSVEQSGSGGAAGYCTYFRYAVPLSIGQKSEGCYSVGGCPRANTSASTTGPAGEFVRQPIQCRRRASGSWSPRPRPPWPLSLARPLCSATISRHTRSKRWRPTAGRRWCAPPSTISPGCPPPKPLGSPRQADVRARGGAQGGGLLFLGLYLASPSALRKAWLEN